MSVRCPQLLSKLVISDDPRLAARLSCRLARRGTYLPIIDGPRMMRPDRETEIIRRNNAAARVGADAVFLANVSDEANDRLIAKLPEGVVHRVRTFTDFKDQNEVFKPTDNEPLQWGETCIGLGLLHALRAGSDIVFGDGLSRSDPVPPTSNHLVVCEQGEPLSEIIAANYAFATGAGLHLIPEVEDTISLQLLEHFYSLYEQRRHAPTQLLLQLRRELRALAGPIPIPIKGSITFITGRLPYGFAFPEVPSTHLFKYPDLGISLINGLVAEQPNTPGIGCAVLIDPEKSEAPEIDVYANILSENKIFVRGYTGTGACVRRVSEAIELFPYDLLVIATHCGDAPGYRWTYRFQDSEGRQRELVVDVAIGVASTDDPEILEVTEFQVFKSLDGVEWNDPKKAEKLYVGTAIKDFVEWSKQKPPKIEPVLKIAIPRVVQSAALNMFDGNYIAVPSSLAETGTPIIINNACGSWHRLAETFTFANARAYIGTLFPVIDAEASQVATALIGRYRGKALPHALWSAQRTIFGKDEVRRPYLFVGVFSQRIRSRKRDMPKAILTRLIRAADNWRSDLKKVDPHDVDQIQQYKKRVDYYEGEAKAIFKNWFWQS